MSIQQGAGTMMTEDEKANVRMCAKDIADQRPKPARVILSDIHDAESGSFEAVWYSESGDRDSSAMCVGKNAKEFRKQLASAIEHHGIQCLLAGGEAPFPKSIDEYERSRVVEFKRR
jgi:hypothetical protein